jgi:hypothetical protein
MHQHTLPLPQGQVASLARIQNQGREWLCWYLQEDIYLLLILHTAYQMPMLFVPKCQRTL